MKIKRVSIILKSLKGKQFFKESIYKVEVMPESNSTDVLIITNIYSYPLKCHHTIDTVCNLPFFSTRGDNVSIFPALNILS